MTDQPPQDQPFQCQYCQRRFKRLEHLQRHERTHTKEAPYQCPCGKAFPRGDLLRRHERSAHNVDTTRRRTSIYSYGKTSPEKERPRKPSNVDWVQSTTPPLDDAGIKNNTFSSLANVSMSQSNGGSAATVQTEDGDAKHPNPGLYTNDSVSIPYLHGDASNGATGTFDEQTNMDWMAFGEPMNDPFDLFGEGDAFLENVDFSSLFLPAGFGLDQNPPMDPTLASNADYQGNIATQGPIAREHELAEPHVEQNSISRFGSPLPSIRPEPKPGSKLATYRDVTSTRPAPCWKISVSDYSALEASLAALLPALPHDFALPSRHTASRYLEGCVRGTYEHMPILHVPSWSVRTAAPDLTLSMLAVGAVFKLEGAKAKTLFYAAKAAILHQLRRRDSKAVSSLIGLETPRTSNGDFSDATSQHTSLGSIDDQHSIAGDRLQSMQAILNLMVLGSWGPRELIGEAITFQSLLAELVRADGVGPESEPTWSPTLSGDKQDAWQNWIRTESLRRTKLFAYTFVNLQSVAFNVAPCMLTSEMQINTPAGQDEWNAKSAESWAGAAQASKIVSTPFMFAFRSLFQPDSTAPSPPSSALANYALIFALLQCIFLLREGRATLPCVTTADSLRPDDVDSISNALQRWQARWENCPESTIDPVSASGPVAFNSTALLRLAWIRLHADLGPCRSLASGDSNLIVEAFKSCPPLRRHPGLAVPIVQAGHALSIPVRLGIAYVSKTQTLSWSVQHSLCNLECAIFVSKWFDTVATTLSTTPLTAQEVGLIYMFRSIVQETGFFKDEAFESPNDEQGWRTLIRHLGTATATLWAEIFSGTHVFDFVSTIGVSLRKYTKQLEDAHTPITADCV
ncbi:uncharacterized protein LTR77_006862 [Saxophila tyrrhenica]|uniref:C2H2-type domain-containing protein n=1 Tax=Saxophila tyrrhenica TaxID=1690608 RepID=A0AAV9P9U1_9PEZI|nr:hypothetical protein LTR77_006862 [Saxophila tyrrhenica]